MRTLKPEVVCRAIVALTVFLTAALSVSHYRAVAQSKPNPSNAVAGDDWNRLYWIDKTARLLRAGEGLGPADDVTALKRLSDEQIVHHFMKDQRFPDAVLDFNLFFLGFKSDTVKADGVYDRSVYGFPSAIASVQELLRNGDYLKLFDFVGPFYMAPLGSERHEESPDPTDKGLSAAEIRIKVVIELESEFLRHIEQASANPDPATVCKDVRALAAREDALTARLHRGFDDSEIFVLIRGRVLSHPFSELREVVEAACDDMAPQAASIGILTAGLERVRSMVERAFDELATFEPERYEPESVSEFRPFDLAALPTPVEWPAFGYEQGLALGNSSTNFNRKRAAYVLKRYFCDDLVPIGVEEPARHASEMHGAQMSCYACHSRLDPMAGFFRNYGAFFYDYSKEPDVIFDDLASREREEYTKSWRSPPGAKREWNVGFIRSPRWEQHNVYGSTLGDLTRVVRQAPEAKRCLMRRLVEYAVAEDQAIDAGYLDALTAAFTSDAKKNSSHAFKNALVRVLQSQAFRARDLDADRCYDFGPSTPTKNRPPCKVAALLERNCGQCHGGGHERKGGLDLQSWIESKELSGKTRRTFRHVGPDGRQMQSRETFARMVERLSTNEPDRRMPLGKVMPAQERQQLFTWLMEEQARHGGVQPP